MLGRDLSGDGVADAVYDTELNITWLRDANVNGAMNWADAKSWASGLNEYGYTGWRLPASENCRGYECLGSEMGHLWYISLGNVAPGPITNSGDFVNLNSDILYWSETEYHDAPANFAWAFYFNSGDQDFLGKWGAFNAMVVQNGDIGSPIPEPAAYALAMSGLCLILLIRRQKS